MVDNQSVIFVPVIQQWGRIIKDVFMITQTSTVCQKRLEDVFIFEALFPAFLALQHATLQYK